MNAQTAKIAAMIRRTKSADGSLTYHVDGAPKDCQIATLTVGRNTAGVYWARIVFRAGSGPALAQWFFPHWSQLLADVDQKRMEYHCPLFPIEEPRAAHWA